MVFFLCFVGQLVEEVKYGPLKAPLHLNACCLHVSVQLCSATSLTVMKPSTTGSLWVTILKDWSLTDAHLRTLQGLVTSLHNSVVMNVLTDALLAVRYRDADVGVFSSVRHQVICLLMATCSSGLFACTRSTDEQGNFTLLYINNYCKLLSELLFVQRKVFQLKKKRKRKKWLVSCLCCRYWCSTLCDVS